MKEKEIEKGPAREMREGRKKKKERVNNFTFFFFFYMFAKRNSN
jgi:hypothetical protein